MAIVTQAAVVATALWPQGDIRDPLGVWGFRVPFTGDATGGSLKAIISEMTGKKGAYVYTCYSVTMVQLTGTLLAAQKVKLRLLTLWPNIDPLAGVQAYGSYNSTLFGGDADFTAPIGGAELPLIQPQQRFLLLFDPRQFGPLGDILEIEFGSNQDTSTYSFEGYGYFWDRSVLNAPGGPRHPGSS